MLEPTQLLEVTHKTVFANGWNEKIVAGFVGPQGSWSLAEAGRLVLQQRAIFHFRGEKLTDLTVLPELQLPPGGAANPRAR